MEKRFSFVWENGEHIDQNHEWFFPGQFDRNDAIVQGCVYVDPMDRYLYNWKCDDLSNFICQLDETSILQGLKLGHQNSSDESKK